MGIFFMSKFSTNIFLKNIYFLDKNSPGISYQAGKCFARANADTLRVKFT